MRANPYLSQLSSQGRRHAQAAGTQAEPHRISSKGGVLPIHCRDYATRRVRDEIMTRRREYAASAEKLESEAPPERS
jgi:hypothetical protein